MSETLAQLEEAVRKLPAREQEELRDWLENLLEDRLELTAEFKAEIAEGMKDIAEGRVRIRRP
jgi:predicted transcriptional regulator